MVELIIPITDQPGWVGFVEPQRAEYMAAAIASMVGVQPVCIFFNGELRIQFSTDQYIRLRTHYAKKWRSNVTREVKRHCAMNGYKPQLRKMVVNYN